MIVDRVYTPGLAQVAYLVADEDAGEVAVIDPRRDVAVYRDWAESRELRITAILETHVHADFVSGARELMVATGAPVYAGRLGGTAFDHVPLDDGDAVQVGSLTLRAFWTPGHTPEHLAYLLFAPDREEPTALFSGDVLFSGEVGRPDLLGSAAQAVLVDQLYETVTNKLSLLPEGTIVYPGHTAGSPCGMKIGDAPQTTIGEEKRYNYAFNQPTKEAFIHVSMEGMPQPPAYYPFMKQINRVGPTLVPELATGDPLTVDDVAKRQAAGALVIDARAPEAFASGHLPGAIAAGLGPSFAIWTGWLTPYDREVVLILSDERQFAEARTELLRIGVDRIAGYLDGGMAAWRTSGRPVDTLALISVEQLAARGAGSKSDLQVLDVRDASERREGFIPASENTPAGEIAQGALPYSNGAAPTAVVCGTGYRSMLAASLLQSRGFRNLYSVSGGMAAWQNANFATARA